jgi:hypothetical protein
MVLSTTLLSLPASGGNATYEYYVDGNPDDVTTPTSAGLLLAGGNTDVAAAMQWMINKSGGGDFVVIRCTGTDAYNPWIYKQLGGVDSCETIIFLSSEACSDPFVIEKIRNAEALFIAGGDQWDYVSMWKGSKLKMPYTMLPTSPRRSVAPVPALPYWVSSYSLPRTIPLSQMTLSRTRTTAVWRLRVTS